MARMDYAHRQTEKLIKKTEKKVREVYGKASEELKTKLDDHMKKFRKKDSEMKKMVEQGLISKEEHAKWRRNNLLAGRRWQQMQDKAASDFRNADKISRKIVNGDRADVYAMNYNWSTYRIEKGLQINTDFTLYSRESVERMLTRNPDMLPPAGKITEQAIRDMQAKRWTKRQMQSVATQAIIQGDSIPDIAKRLANEVGEKNCNAMIRNARTMMTGAQNAGRIEAHDRAREMGIKVDDYWVSTFDERTRESHRAMNGEKRGDDGYFSNGLQFPADPSGDPAEVYNCRCTLVGQIRGFEDDLQTFDVQNDPDVGGMTYDEWLEAKPKYK